jgi:anti-sigma regulatory factor (Ser/Thr protein kinase)
VASVELQLPQTASSPSVARREISDYLSDRGLSDLCPAAELVVSELVSNAVRHATGPICLRLSGERALRIEVVDGDPRNENIIARRVDAQSLTGRGLRVVSVLAQRWGSIQGTDSKTVWAELAPGRR